MCAREIRPENLLVCAANGALDWEKKIRTGSDFWWGKSRFYFLEENWGWSVDLGVEQVKSIPAHVVIEIGGKARIVGIEGKFVSEDILEGTLLGFNDWFYDGHEFKGAMALTTT